MALPPIVARLRERIRPVTAWISSHRWSSAIIAVLLVILLEYATFPSAGDVTALARTNPPTTALMEQRADEARSAGKPWAPRQQWVRLNRVSDHLQHAVIVAEDGMFYEHDGVDWYEMKESIKKDIQKRRFARGGSTITQQLAKNLFLSTSKDPVRKLKEFILSDRLEDALTKNRILEIYLNVIEWGDGVFGVEAASVRYFGKHASELTREDAARLAAVIPSPRRHSPTSQGAYVTRRTRMILARMAARGW
jgi:monofunctional biosynthetic peptidoglycan transglycosylase